MVKNQSLFPRIWTVASFHYHILAEAVFIFLGTGITEIHNEEDFFFLISFFKWPQRFVTTFFLSLQFSSLSGIFQLRGDLKHLSPSICEMDYLLFYPCCFVTWLPINVFNNDYILRKLNWMCSTQILWLKAACNASSTMLPFISSLPS